MRLVKISLISLLVIVLIGSSGYLYFKNREIKKSYQEATQQITELQAKINAIGSFSDVYTVKTDVEMGQKITDDDLILQTVLSSTIPANAITDKQSVIGKYFRINFKPGITLTNDLVNQEEYIGSVYDRDLFLDSLPIGTKVGDYLDIRVVLPGGEEFVVYPHKRVDAKIENSIKMRLDEADLWLYSSLIRDRAIYRPIGLQVYATKYNDPGSHDKTVAYYPVRKEVVDVMNISPNLTDAQRSRVWNESIRNSIDAKLRFYSDPLNLDAPKIQGGVSNEESRQNSASNYYDSAIESGVINNSKEEGLKDPNGSNSDLTSSSDTGNGPESIGDLSEGSISEGKNLVNQSGDYITNIEDKLFDDKSPIE